VTPTLIHELQQFEERKATYVKNKAELEKDKELWRQKKNALYYFQHPYLRLLVPCAVTILNIYQFAEDPISLSVKDCHISGFGNLYSLIFTNYPPDGMSAVKVGMWLFAVLFSMVFGKVVVHYWFFCKKLKLKIFTKEGQGSWIVIFLFTCCVLFFQSTVYNAFLTLAGSEYDEYHCDSNLHLEYRSFMKGAALVTWVGDFFTVWMVLDTMLQEPKYTHWMKWTRSWWTRNNIRVFLFWGICLSFGIIMITGITTDFIQWDHFNKGFHPTDELSRSFLASAILILDLIIVMQDWDFPHFSSTTNLKLPGMTSKSISFKIPQCFALQNKHVDIQGKWFNYGVLSIVMVLDMYQWKNQIYYQPHLYGQYTDSEGSIYTITDREYLRTANQSTITQWWRNNTSDPKTKTKYLDYSITKRGTAFLPAIVAFLAFIYVTTKYAERESDQEKMVRHWYTSKFTKKRKSRKVQPVKKKRQGGISDSSSSSESEMEQISPAPIGKSNTDTFTYYYQHPNIRLLFIVANIFLCSLFIAEDPIAHSNGLAKADIIGNIQNLVFGEYPHKGEYFIFKAFTWVSGALFGLVVGKVFVHGFLLNGIFQLKLFRRNQGSWVVMFLTMVIMLYCFSIIFNHITKLDPDELAKFYITNQMGIKYKTFMNGVGLTSFFAHVLFSLMVTDAIFQERHYTRWAKFVRRIWKKKYFRLPVSWLFAVSITVLAVLAIVFDLFQYKGVASYSTDELGRACLAACIIMFDILILTQDWEYPRFKINQRIKLPGLDVCQARVKMCFIDFTIKGRWFTYSLMGVFLFIDAYNFKNALVYKPESYHQYVNSEKYIVSYVKSEIELAALNSTESTLLEGEKLNGKFEGYSDDTRYGVSLILPIFAFLFSLVFGFIRSRMMYQTERKMKTRKRLKNIPRVEDMRVRQRTGFKLKPIGNIRPIYHT
uniref:Transmembrane protein n=2 Tax=Clytia hemisphaerica TaxID=252671 RepID=A0A7M5UJW0_9CNID